MIKQPITPGLNINREQMIQLLNEDLAGEYQAIIAYTVYSQVLKRAAYTEIARELETHAGEELAHAIKIARALFVLQICLPVAASMQTRSPEERQL